MYKQDKSQSRSGHFGEDKNLEPLLGTEPLVYPLL